MSEPKVSPPLTARRLRGKTKVEPASATTGEPEPVQELIALSRRKPDGKPRAASFGKKALQFDAYSYFFVPLCKFWSQAAPYMVWSSMWFLALYVVLMMFIIVRNPMILSTIVARLLLHIPVTIGLLGRDVAATMEHELTMFGMSMAHSLWQGYDDNEHHPPISGTTMLTTILAAPNQTAAPYDNSQHSHQPPSYSNMPQPPAPSPFGPAILTGIIGYLAARQPLAAPAVPPGR